MSQTIITQDGTAVNYAAVRSVFIAENEVENTKTGEVLTMDIIAAKVEGEPEPVPFGFFDTEGAADAAFDRFKEWLSYGSEYVFKF